MTYPILCHHSDARALRRMADAVTEFGGGLLAVEICRKADGVADSTINRSTPPAAILAGGTHARDLLQEFCHHPSLAIIGRVLVDDSGEDDGHCNIRIPSDFQAEEIATALRGVLTDFVLSHAPERMRELGGLLDAAKLAHAWLAERARADAADARMRDLQGAVLGADDISDAGAERSFIAEADRLFERPDRTCYDDGEIIFHEGKEADGLRAIIGGHVELFRSINGEDVPFYVETRGHLVGLMSLSRGGPAFFSCRALGPVKLLHLTRGMLRKAVMASPRFVGLLVTVILRSLARRNRHASQLLLKVQSLNRTLAARKDQLEIALADLEAAQVRLVETGKMATLGNLAAGMAHELNNPATALLLASECLRDDLQALLNGPALSPVAAEAMTLGYSRKPLSTRDERALKEDMMKTLGGDRALASTLVASGVTDGKTLDRLLALSPGEDRDLLMTAMGHGARAGSALRGIETCSRRISKLTGSLKMYARNDEERIGNVDLNGTMEDVLLIVGNRLRGIEVHKEYGTPPAICCIPSQIEQVWTNLIVNAAQAMEGGGILRIRTMAGESGFARVEVEDDGPGIPDDLQGHVFESRFTTKSGRVEFGLGLGLPICQSIVTRHGGRIGYTSGPGRTLFHVELPVTFPIPSQP
jgi:two-component system NtrC family sensor kinase